MVTVIQFPRKLPRKDVVAHYEKQLARAKAGEIRGGMETLCTVDGEESSIFGEYAEDLEFAVSSARAGFECLLGHSKLINPHPLPLRLRKEYRNEANDPLVLRVRG